MNPNKDTEILPATSAVLHHSLSTSIVEGPRLDTDHLHHKRQPKHPEMKNFALVKKTSAWRIQKLINSNVVHLTLQI